MPLLCRCRRCGGAAIGQHRHRRRQLATCLFYTVFYAALRATAAFCAQPMSRLSLAMLTMMLTALLAVETAVAVPSADAATPINPFAEEARWLVHAANWGYMSTLDRGPAESSSDTVPAKPSGQVAISNCNCRFTALLCCCPTLPRINIRARPLSRVDSRFFVPITVNLLHPLPPQWHGATHRLGNGYMCPGSVGGLVLRWHGLSCHRATVVLHHDRRPAAHCRARSQLSHLLLRSGADGQGHRCSVAAEQIPCPPHSKWPPSSCLAVSPTSFSLMLLLYLSPASFSPRVTRRRARQLSKLLDSRLVARHGSTKPPLARRLRSAKPSPTRKTTATRSAAPAPASTLRIRGDFMRPRESQSVGSVGSCAHTRGTHTHNGIRIEFHGSL